MIRKKHILFASFVVLLALLTMCEEPPLRLFLIHDGGVGFIDKNGRVVIKPNPRISNVVGDFSEGLICISVGEKYGYMDIRGNIVIEPRRFDSASVFSEGLAKVRTNGKSGYIDRKGRVVIDLQFECASDFSEGLAAVEVCKPFPVVENGKVVKVINVRRYGFIDRKGRMVIEPIFDDAGDFHEGLAAVETEKGWGYIDRTGRMVIEPQFLEASDFYADGLAIVRVVSKSRIVTSAETELNERVIMGMGSKVGFIDKTGRFVIEPKFDDANPFYEGLAAVRVGDKWGYIDKTGRMVIKPRFSSAWSFSEGLADVAVIDEKGFEKWGFIDKSGKMVIAPQFDCVVSFSEGLAAVCFRVGDDLASLGPFCYSPDYKWGYIDRTGKMVVEPKFVGAESFSEGIAYVVLTAGTVIGVDGYIDKTGRFVWGPNYRGK